MYVWMDGQRSWWFAVWVTDRLDGWMNVFDNINLKSVWKTTQCQKKK